MQRLRLKLDRLACRVLGHRWQLQDHEPITTFWLCVRCGRWDR